MVRPSEEILNHFYGLADLDDATRLKSVQSIVSHVKSEETARNYCVERLISGLSSARAAARIGYSTALAHLLAEDSQAWPLSKLLKHADKHLDLADKEMVSNNAIAHHLLLTAVVESGAYKEDLSTVTEREFVLHDKFPFLSFSVAGVLSAASQELSLSEFKQLLWPSISKRLADGSLLPQFLFLLLRLKNKFPTLISDIVPYVNEDGTLKWADFTDHFLIAVFKGLDKACLWSLLELWLNTAKAEGGWAEAYARVLKWAGVQDARGMDRLLTTTTDALQMVSTAEELLVVVSEDFMSRIRKATRERRTAGQKTQMAAIFTLSSALAAKVDELKESQSETLFALLEAFDKVPNFDAVVHTKVTEKIISKLDAEHIRKFVAKAASVEESGSEWSLRRLMGAFPSLSAPSKNAALSALFSLEAAKEHVLLTAGQCVDSLFRIKVRPGELATATLSEEDEKTIWKIISKELGRDAKNAEKTFRSAGQNSRELGVLWACLQFWKKTSSDEDEKKEYTKLAEEVLHIAKSSGEKDNAKVLLDLLISLLGQPRRFHRIVVCFVFSSLLPSINSDLIQHILNGLTMSNAQLAGAEGEEDEDEEEDMEEGSEAEKSGDEEEEEEEEEEDEEDLQGMGDVDTGLVEKLQQALGKAAVVGDGEDDKDDDEISISDVGDEEMFKLDEGLVSAFRAMSSKSIQGTAAARFAKPLRMRLADLLLFAVSSQQTPDTVKLEMIIPLVHAAKELMKTGSDEDAVKKIMELLNIIAHLKKVAAKEKQILAIFKELVAEAQGFSNPALNSLTGAIASCLFSLGSKPSPSEKLKSTYIDVFKQFITQENSAISAELATAAILRHPASFADNATLFIEFAFDENVRVFRRTESLQCALMLSRKDVLRESDCGKAAAKALKPAAALLLSVSTAEDKEQQPKPRFIATLLKLLLQLAGDHKAKAVLSKSLLPAVAELLSSSSLFSSGGALSKCNQACQKAAGKSAHALLSVIHKKLEQE